MFFICRHDRVPGLIKHNFFIHLKINLLIWSVLDLDQETGDFQELQSSRIYRSDVMLKIKNLLPIAARLLHTISEHYKILNTNWYKNMANFSNEILKQDPLSFYIPCPSCLSPKAPEDGVNGDNELADQTNMDSFLQSHIYKGENKVVCFSSRECIAQHFGKRRKSPRCFLHGNIPFNTLCPDLVFAHMGSGIENKNVEIKHNDILGIGGFGLVTKGILNSQDGEQEVALKFLVKSPEEKAENFQHFLLKAEGYQDSELLEMHSTLLTEMSYCVGLKHDNVVKLLQIGFEVYFFLMFELAPLGSLKNVLEKYSDPYRHLPYQVILRTMRGICAGLNYLHNDLKIIHMDMKPDNILVWEYPFPDEKGQIDEQRLLVKIADYGLAYIYTAMDNKLKYAMGTHGYMAPEVILSNGSIFPKVSLS